MATLTEIISARLASEKELTKLTEEYRAARDRLTEAIAFCKEQEAILGSGLDLEKINLGRKILRIQGDPYGITDGCSGKDNTIAEEAVRDIMDGCRKLRTEYFGNKRYGRYYQRNDCRYGWGPSCGGIVDRIGLRNWQDDFRELTPEEVEAAIYYIRNYNQIKNISND